MFVVGIIFILQVIIFFLQNEDQYREMPVMCDEQVLLCFKKIYPRAISLKTIDCIYVFTYLYLFSNRLNGL